MPFILAPQWVNNLISRNSDILVNEVYLLIYSFDKYFLRTYLLKAHISGVECEEYHSEQNTLNARSQKYQLT